MIRRKPKVVYVSPQQLKQEIPDNTAALPADDPVALLAKAWGLQLSIR